MKKAASRINLYTSFISSILIGKNSICWVLIKCVITGLLICIFSFFSIAQNGAIQGKIQSQDGKPLEFVSIGLQGTTLGSTTNTKGEFEIKNVKAGNYVLQASSIGFESYTFSITVGAGKVLKLSIQLKPQSHQLNEVVIDGNSKARQLSESSKSVLVIETKEVKLKSGDLAQVISQSQGVNIRRSGGLGSDARFSLNGLTDDQIRFFVDGIPLSFSGYSFGFSNIPVNLVDRIEIYKGVVPASLGSDALGGAVNIVTPRPKTGWHGSASYQVGSFGTHRASASAEHVNDSTGLVVGVNGFYDNAQNNYKVDVDVPNDKGKLQNVRLRRFHDAYYANGAKLYLGFRDRRWAKDIGISLFATEFSKELQNNNVMTIPYGAVQYGRKSLGATFRYHQAISKKISFDLLMGYSWNTINYVDTTTSIYDWYGDVVGHRLSTAELGRPSDQLQWEKNIFTRLNLEYLLSENQKITLSMSPSRINRNGEERKLLDSEGRDPLDINQELSTLINGLEYELNASAKLQNMLFVKQYIQVMHSGEYIAGGAFRERNQHSANYGIGDGLRYMITNRLKTKVSYEWAARLPRTDEVFGDGALVLPNLNLKPERSHNGNLEISFSERSLSNTKWNAGISGFVRATNDLITVLGSDKVFQYFNIAKATSAGVELSGSWTSIKDRLTVHGNATWINFRNKSTKGTYNYYQGDRIPNRPYLFGNAGAQYNFYKLKSYDDMLSIFWSAQYIHGFYRGWESAGIKEFKQVIPSQFVNNGGATYKLVTSKLTTAISVELQNLTNAKVFDNFGVQKPGRTFYTKITFQL